MKYTDLQEEIETIARQNMRYFYKYLSKKLLFIRKREKGQSQQTPVDGRHVLV